jgi:MerR family transcriptional regulator, light-induced transcriptional regulator
VDLVEQVEQRSGLLRIGELSRRVGVSDHLLRAWETRYGLFHPTRSAGGFRLYSSADEDRVRRMQFHLGEGLSAAEAAHSALADMNGRPAIEAGALKGTSTAGGIAALSARLKEALENFDEAVAQAILDRLLSDFTVATVLGDVVLPYLHDLGERWTRSEVSIAQEHFASHVIRGRLASLARGWGSGRGPRVIIACPPGELHDLPIMIFGIIVSRSGWRVDYLGANTPIEEVIRLAEQVHPDLIVVAAVTADRLDDVRTQLARLAGIAPLALAGAGATQLIADQVGARLLTGDPVTAAEHEGQR